MVIVAIGSETCTELYKDSPIAMSEDHFIKVNQRLETSVEHVLAVGDISKYPLQAFNLDEANCQHWQMACSTGHQAGKRDRSDSWLKKEIFLECTLAIHS